MVRFPIPAWLLCFLLCSVPAQAQYICVEGNCENGVGKKQVKNSNAYLKGTFENGIFKEGTVVFPNGNIFTGKYKNHKLIQGTKVFKNGRKMTGKFVENVLVEGTITEKDGSSRPIKLKPLGTR